MSTDTKDEMPLDGEKLMEHLNAALQQLQSARSMFQEPNWVATVDGIITSLKEFMNRIYPQPN